MHANKWGENGKNRAINRQERNRIGNLRTMAGFSEATYFLFPSSPLANDKREIRTPVTYSRDRRSPYEEKTGKIKSYDSY